MRAVFFLIDNSFVTLGIPLEMLVLSRRYNKLAFSKCPLTPLGTAPMASHRKSLLAIAGHNTCWVFASAFLSLVTLVEAGFGQGPPIPQPALNWEFENTTSEEVSRGDVWTLQDRTTGSQIHYGGWFSGGLTVNNWGNETMLGNSQLPFNNDPHLNVNQGWLWFQKEADTEK